MEPRIQFTTTKEGVRIAYARIGDVGPPVIWNRTPGIGIFDTLRTFPGIEMLARQTRIILFDQAGSGASQRTNVDVSIAGQVSTLEAVADLVDINDLTVVGVSPACIGAAAYVAANQDRVARLICFNPAPVDTEIWSLDFLRGNWSMSRRFIAHNAFPDGPVERQKEFARAMADAVSHENYVRYYESNLEAEWGVPYYRRITIPTLVVQHIKSPRERARLEVVVSAMPHCEYVERPGTFGVAADSTENAELALRFIGLNPIGLKDASSGTAIILFADIADHTAIIARIGDAAFREKARPLDEALRQAVRAHGGTVVDAKTLGDGILSTFPAAAPAIAAALRLETAAAAAGLGLHIGLHAGDVLREIDADGRSNVFGGAVNIAARISALAPPGEILVSRTVADLARTSAGVTFEDRGEHTLKGIDEPQRVFAVRSVPG